MKDKTVQKTNNGENVLRSLKTKILELPWRSFAAREITPKRAAIALGAILLVAVAIWGGTRHLIENSQMREYQERLEQMNKSLPSQTSASFTWPKVCQSISDIPEATMDLLKTTSEAYALAAVDSEAEAQPEASAHLLYLLTEKNSDTANYAFVLSDLTNTEGYAAEHPYAVCGFIDVTGKEVAANALNVFSFPNAKYPAEYSGAKLYKSIEEFEKEFVYSAPTNGYSVEIYDYRIQNETKPGPDNEKISKLAEQIAGATDADWYYTAVATAYESGLLANGESLDNRTTVSVAEIAAVVAMVNSQSTEKPIRDICSGDSWYAPYLSYLATNDIVPVSVLSGNANRPATQEDVAAMRAGVSVHLTTSTDKLA